MSSIWDSIASMIPSQVSPRPNGLELLWTQLVSCLKAPATNHYLSGFTDNFITSDLHSDSFNPINLIGSPEEHVWTTFTNLHSEQSTPSGAVNPEGFLPSFIKPLPVMMNQDTIECLHINGTFALPNVPLQNALLQAFSECVLPSMPIVEWQPLIQALHGAHGSHGSISLLLYHAIMVSAATFVDIRYILDAGYSTRQEAQESFFQKARLLYQANTETDSLTVIQAFLLMAYRLDTTDGDDSRSLIGIAISTALSIGLFHDISQTINSPYRPTLWRRLAWSCHIMDCQIALRLRRRPIIQRADFCHQMVLESDFDHLQNLASQSSGMPLDTNLSRNFSAQRELSLIFIANARLSVCIRNVLDIQCKESQLRSSASPTTPTSSTSDDSDYSNSIYVSERMLAEWASALPKSCQTNPSEPQDIDEEPAIAVQRSLLHIIFYTTIAVFHQSRLFPSSNFCVQHASQQITSVSFDLYRRGLHSRLPIVGVTGILVALVIHISEMKAPPSIQKDQATQNFQLGLEIMANLRDVYSEANRVTSWALKIIQQNGAL
ncbi:hypothetical protein N7509_004634 [Penicillium cosmopolitanum]|uniref:Xylanolytic transcriptional activator regulatory domain-containing protein n=1 Tax=Penicillium cosmopolitanum TaxID=1131564 RepID=A0A9W9W122_9EURO|nr:uncharacterized protein N7509_004634 [Penicillium cosmopolitanum]KAJ5396521.1 hypothetical protein N7509_004634 [Penicillium cosmopolitanum]